MSIRYSNLAACLITLPLYAFTYCPTAQANDPSPTTYDKSYFSAFGLQTALEMVERIPGFTIQSADEERGLSQGGTNVLINGQAITGKGDSAIEQIAQISAKTVAHIEIIDATSLDIPGYTGLVANIITQKTSATGSWLWEPEWYPRAATAWANGNVSLSGSHGDVDFSGAFNSVMVRAGFFGPETLTEADGTLYETRDETFLIYGEQPTLSGALSWNPAEDRTLNAKASITKLNINRPQTSRTKAITDRGFDSFNLARQYQDQTRTRLDVDYRFPALGGSLKLIAFGSQIKTGVGSRVTIENLDAQRLSDQRFTEQSIAREAVARFEQNWLGANSTSWQLAGEAVFNDLDLETEFRAVDPSDNQIVLFGSDSNTLIREHRGEMTLAHRRNLTEQMDIQLSIGGEFSKIEQGSIERNFFRPKGFVSMSYKPAERWTLTGKFARDVGQINFRNFAANVSLVDQVSTADNPELVPQQSWNFFSRAEHRFKNGHVASLEAGHDLIDDLVDRIPFGMDGDAIGNIDKATQTRFAAALSLQGAPIGLKGAQLDLRGTWQWSSLIDPIEGFERDIRALRTKDLRLDYRHDIPETDWSYGLTLQTITLAPEYRSNLIQTRSVPGGGLTPGINFIFIEHKDLFGLRVRATVSEFLEQENKFRRIIYSGRRDNSNIDRIESRVRDLDGPYIKLSLGKTF